MTSEPPVPTKAELLDALRASGRVAVERLRKLPPEQFESGRYEGGWNGRQILAHFASIEWTYPRLLDLAKQPAAPAPEQQPAQVRRTAPEEAGDRPAAPMRGGIAGYNERQVEKRAGATVDELLAEFAKNRAATIAAIEGVDEPLLATEIRSAGGITGALAQVVYATVVQHVLGHAGDILGERLTVES